MDWLKIQSQENQDMDHELIGNLIMQDGFKVRYTNVELYSEKLRETFQKTFAKHGYTISITYRNDFQNCEITALKTKHRYLDYAMFIGILWAAYRCWTYTVSHS